MFSFKKDLQLKTVEDLWYQFFLVGLSEDLFSYSRTCTNNRFQTVIPVSFFFSLSFFSFFFFFFLFCFFVFCFLFCFVLFLFLFVCLFLLFFVCKVGLNRFYSAAKGHAPKNDLRLCGTSYVLTGLNKDLVSCRKNQFKTV